MPFFFLFFHLHTHVPLLHLHTHPRFPFLHLHTHRSHSSTCGISSLVLAIYLFSVTISTLFLFFVLSFKGSVGRYIPMLMLPSKYKGEKSRLLTRYVGGRLRFNDFILFIICTQEYIGFDQVASPSHGLPDVKHRHCTDIDESVCTHGFETIHGMLTVFSAQTQVLLRPPNSKCSRELGVERF